MSYPRFPCISVPPPDAGLVAMDRAGDAGKLTSCRPSKPRSKEGMLL
jgi:hypothetical protein